MAERGNTQIFSMPTQWFYFRWKQVEADEDILILQYQYHSYLHPRSIATSQRPAPSPYTRSPSGSISSLISTSSRKCPTPTKSSSDFVEYRRCPFRFSGVNSCCTHAPLNFDQKPWYIESMIPLVLAAAFISQSVIKRKIRVAEWFNESSKRRDYLQEVARSGERQQLVI